MQTISLGGEFLRTLSRFRKKKENLSSYVHFLYKTSYSLIRKFHFIVLESTPGRGGGGGLLPYITYTGMCRPTGS